VRTSRRMVGFAGALLIMATTAIPAFASSHREAPLIASDPAADHTDVFAWVDGTATNKVNLVVNVSPMQDPAGGPNFWQFDPKVRYEIKIDNDRDARADITYRFTFKTLVRNQGTFLYNTGQVTGPNDVDLNVRQTYTLTRIYENGITRVLGSNLPVAPINVGRRSTPSYADTAAKSVKVLDGGFKVFAGQRDDPFFVDLGSIFDLGGLRPFNPAHIIPLGAEAGVDDLQANNVLTIALQVPIRHITKGGQLWGAANPKATVGIWAANYRQSTTVINIDGTNSTSGPWRQVSRMANPLVNEVIIPRGRKDLWNRRSPHGDSIFEKYYLKPELAGLINFLYPSLPDTRTSGRSDLSLILLNGLPGLNSTGAVKADLLRLNTGIPACTADSAEDDIGSCRRLGAFYDDAADLAAWPNGRRPSDDVTDMAIRAIADGYGAQLNSLYGVPNQSPNNQLGDGVDTNDQGFLSWFPYIATPNQGYEHDHHEPL
jgi:hypothetical protein